MSVLLAFVGLIVAVNPPRRSLELSPRPRPAIAVVAGLGAVGAVIALGATSGPVLDALDISASTFRVGAGLVLGFRALLDLVLTPKIEPEGLGGWGEALLPVAFPVLLRPETAVLAISAGADVGVAATTLGAVLAVALGVAAVTWWPGNRGARPLGAMLSVGAVVVGVALVVDGVLDI